MEDRPIRCHGADPALIPGPYGWRVGFTPGVEPPIYEYCGKRHYGPFQTWRTCQYCGSMHPADLLAALDAGARLGGADWKYGWPHKFYVTHIPNPYPDLPIVTSHGGGSVWTCGEPHPAGPTLRGKWYNTHLQDLRDDALLPRLLDVIAVRAGIRFAFKPEGTLRYTAPYRGYQGASDDEHE